LLPLMKCIRTSQTNISAAAAVSWKNRRRHWSWT